MKQETTLGHENRANGETGAGFVLRLAASLAVVCLLTFGLLAASVEFLARQIFRRSATQVWSCFAPSAAATGIRPIPNSVCWEKLPESPLVEYRFNACGHRTTAGCGPKPEGAVRVVLIGSSQVLGYQVPYDETFAFRLEHMLSAASGRQVEVDNQGVLFGTPRATSLRFGEALADKPDLILWTLSPWDVQNVIQTQDVLPLAEVDRNGGPPPPKWRRYLNALRKDGIKKLLLGTRSVLMMQHLLYLSPSQYMKNYLMQADDPGIFAREAPPAWRKRWSDLDAIARDMEEQAKAAGIPFAVTAVPDLAGALMLVSGDWAPQLDPRAFGDRIRSIAERHGGVYLDVLSGFRQAPDPERLYYVVDGHMNPEAHALLSRLLADRLTSGFAVLKRQGPGGSAGPAGR